MAIADGWSRAGTFSLDREGFALKEFHHSFDRFDDDEAVRSQFYTPVAEFVRNAVGARRVVVFDHTIRSKVNEQQQTAEHTTTQRAPVMIVHCDYTPVSGPLRVRQLLPDEADAPARAPRRVLQLLEAAEAPRRGKAAGDVRRHLGAAGKTCSR